MLIVTISRLAERFSYIYSFINKRAILIVLRYCNWSKKLQSTSFNACPIQDVSYTKTQKQQKARSLARYHKVKMMPKWEDFIEMKENIAVIFHLFNIGVSSFSKWESLSLWVINSITLATLLKLDNLKYCKTPLVYRFLFVTHRSWSYR